MRMKTAAMTLALVGLVGCANGYEQLERHSKAAQPCRPGDTCSVLPATACTCAVPVNTRHLEALQKRAADVDCDGAPVKACPETVGEAKCIDDRCAFAR